MTVFFGRSEDTAVSESKDDELDTAGVFADRSVISSGTAAHDAANDGGLVVGG
jgi:hypothetical protein